MEKFYIYDNESTDNTKEVLKSYIDDGTVEYIYWKGFNQQAQAYEDALKRYKYETKWMGFIDIDEFIVPIIKETIPDIIKELKPKFGLSMHWLIYGDSGHKKKTDGLVIERFTKHSIPTFERNVMLKTIINPRAFFSVWAHYGISIGNIQSTDENGRKVSAFSSKFTHKKIRVNHYWGKSYEEFQIKKHRGDIAKAPNNIIPDEPFFYNNRNDVEDKTTMQKYIKPIKENLKKRGLI